MVLGVFHDLGFLHLYGLSDFRQIPVTSFMSSVKRVCRPHPNSDWAVLGLKRKVWKIVTTLYVI